MDTIVQSYQELMAQVDRWFARCLEIYPEKISCQSGCSACCRSLFDITMLDAYHLGLGFALLRAQTKEVVLAKCRERLRLIQEKWPEFAHPYVLNHRPEEQWEALTPDDDETPCVLLDENGRCLVYAHRPMTCRLHGIPLLEMDGQVLDDEWCTLNFVDGDPLELAGLRAPFDAMFRQEASLIAEFTGNLLGRGTSQLDTFIPMALLIDFDNFDWQAWLSHFKPADTGE